MYTKYILLPITILFCIYLVGCMPTEPPDAPCPIAPLVLDAELFPANTAAGEILSPWPDSGKNSAGRSIYMEKGLANHYVIYSSLLESISEDYEKMTEGIFGPNSIIEWEEPSELTFKSSTADRFQAGCGLDDSVRMCFMTAQYQTFITFFNIHLYEGTADVHTADELMQEVDRRITSCLETIEDN